MTACVNKKSKRVAAVVTASLVGALSIGAPAVALAANANIDMLVAGDIEDVAAGKVTAYTDQDGKVLDSLVFAAGDEAQYVIPTEVTTKTGQVLDVAKGVADGDLELNYYMAVSAGGTEVTVDGKPYNIQWVNNASSIKTAGTYFVGVRAADSNSAAENVFLKFEITNKTLNGAELVSKGGESYLTYKGSAHVIGSDYFIELDGNKFAWDDPSDGFAASGYYFKSAEVFKKGGLGATDALEAGDYIIRVVGSGSFTGSTVEIPFTVKPLDLSKAEIVLDTATVATTATALPKSVTTADGVALSNVDVLALTFVSSSNGQTTPQLTKGTFNYKVAVKDNADKNSNVINSADVQVIRYEKVATFKYDGKEIAEAGDIDLDLTSAEYDSLVNYNADKVTVAGGKASLKPKFAYAKLDANGNWVGTDDITKPGTYKATVSAMSDDCTYGGSVTIKFKVNATKIAVKDIFVTYDGKVTGDQLDVVYNGSDFLSQLKVSATDENGKEVPAGELVLEAKEGTKAVDKIVDAGTYTVTVKAKDGSMYVVGTDSDSFKIVVSPIVLTKAVLHGTVRDYTNGKLVSEFLPYTGSVLTPSWTFEDKDGAVEVPESAWKVSYDKEVKDAVDYTATFSRTVGTKNYDFTGLTKKFTVAEAKSFGDVENSDWFVGAVFQAKENGYVNGVKGTKLFNPKAEITRADAVCILYNMAGGKKVEDMTKAEKLAWTSKVTFTDVNVDEYYGVAMGWADSLDIANGSNGKFRPTETITREEFAALLSNYAKATGDYEAVDADEVLGSATDYTAWAKDVVAWAKANGIMGNNGAAINGTGVITRAEVAAMAVNYQPEAL